MNNKILIIGQAPPANKQLIPYDSTMLYEWLEMIGVSKNDALDIFYFDAVYDKFPGYNSNGGHLKPTEKQMDDYWDRELRLRVNDCKAILVLGACARDYLKSKNIDKPISFTIHPSKRNYSLYLKNKDSILNKIRNLIAH
jgi:uracil-DNA glycosylase